MESQKSVAKATQNRREYDIGEFARNKNDQCYMRNCTPVLYDQKYDGD